MARKPRARDPSPLAEDSPSSKSSTVVDEEDHETLSISDPPTEINPYQVLSLEPTATPSQIKSAYHKAALQHHPDKTSDPALKASAHTKFQEIAFAYAILSDTKRRARYDATGNTAESLEEDDGDFDWVDFFRSQSEQVISVDAMDKFKSEYQGSEEEKEDLLKAYKECEGDMDGVFERVMCCDVLVDEERFRGIIDEAMGEGRVQAYVRYTKESGKTRKKRRGRARAEEAEAMELAEELGVRETLFGKGGGGKKKKEKGGGEDALEALIQQRAKGRAENFFDGLEAKYGGGGGATKRKSRVEEPSEEMFARNRKKTKSKT